MALDASRVGDRGRAVAPARVRRRRVARAAHPADQRAVEPRAAPGDADTARTPRSPSPRCARRGACAAWWPTCCCWPAPTPAGWPRASPSTCARSSATRPPRRCRWPGDRSVSVSLAARATRPRRSCTDAADDLHRLVLNLIENALRHTPEGTSVDVSAAIDDDRRGPRGRRRRPRHPGRAARPHLRPLRARRRRHQRRCPPRRQRPRPRDRQGGGRVAQRERRAGRRGRPARHVLRRAAPAGPGAAEDEETSERESAPARLG